MEKAKRGQRSATEPAQAGAARLYALVAGGALCLLGVLGFFYDASFDTGSSLASDYLAGTLLVNGWRNVIYLATGFAALALASRAPRAAAFALGGFYLLLGAWGLIETERGIGDILGALPLGDRDNVFHLVVGALGIGAGLMETPRPAVKLPKRRRRKRKPKGKPKPAAEKRLRASPEKGEDEARAGASESPGGSKVRGERGSRERRRAGRPRDAGA